MSMTQNERLIYLIQYLLDENNMHIDLPQGHDELFALYRALVNIREAKSVSQTFLNIQDVMLQEENAKKGVVSFDEASDRILLWRGDITRLKVDAIVNAANNQMEGCFVPGHQCIDNAIHTFAGVQLRNECHHLMQRQGYLEPTGQAKITKSYNLPSRYILHTVGPIVTGAVTHKDEVLLASCYESCLRLAEKYQLQSIAFCCISTGVFHFPNEHAAKITFKTVHEYLQHSTIEKVIFNVFKECDEKIYLKLFD
ncbi:protein-ADP-ribose hydrolase [Clostridium sp. AUH-JLR23]|uniref:protein-ADP-ribose hydrolase n=1 Tax=Clostridium sp. AUH-JLR23 TaxID=1505062 RepID=UPI00356353BF